MTFWIIATLLAAFVAATLVLPLLRPRAGAEGAASDGAPHDPEAATAGTASDVAIYRDQLAEVDRDLARGVIDPAEAERARTEISRRLLAADRAGPAPRREAPRGATLAVAALAVAVTVGGAGALYLRLGAPGYPDLPLQARLSQGEEMRRERPSQAQAEAAFATARAAAGQTAAGAGAAGQDGTPAGRAPAAPGAAQADAQYLRMVEQLRRIVPTRPEDIEGWRLLARHEAALGDYAAAARAQERVIALSGDAATPADRIALVDRMVAAAGGLVSPEAEAVIERVLAEAPRDMGARYYMGLLYAQTDRPDIAFRLWRDVVAEGDPERDVHVRLARGQVEEAAFRAGIEYALPTVASGPSAADMAAAADMAPEDREAMIRGMVANLSDRLATQGGPVAEWARLISAYGVLGETGTAAEILAEAREVFGTSPEALAVLDEAAASAGLER